MRHAVTVGIAVVMTVLVTAGSVFAVTFKDQADIEKLQWAKDAIMEMAEKNIISGMPDGTFRPADSIKKLDSLILVAKVLGANEPSMQNEVTAAEQQYGSYLNNYSIYGKREVSYLLYKDIIKTAELDSYIGANSATATMLRYEAAILLVKAMREEESATGSSIIILPFADQSDIPERARPYVDYLYKADIMKGVSTTEFAPYLPVTRAQMAVLLHKASSKIRELDSEIKGTISKIETDLNLVWVKPQDGTAQRSFPVFGAAIKVNGQTKSISALEREMAVTVKLRDNKVYELIAEDPEVALTERGIVSGTSTSGSTRKIKVNVEKDGTTEVKEYEIGSWVTVMKNDIKVLNTDIRIDDYVVIELVNDGAVYRVTVEPKVKKVSGEVKAIKTDLPASITIETNGEESTYTVLDTVGVVRGGRARNFRDIRVGDAVTLTLHYNKVKEVSATGSRMELEGTLEEMLISRSPKITIKNVSGNIETYAVADDASITIGGESKTFYDLRVGYRVELNLDSETVVSVTAEETKEAQQVTGTITDVNANIGVVAISPDIDDTSGIQHLYFPRNGTVRIVNALTGEILSTNSLKKGQKITAFGYYELGVFVVTQMTIIAN